MLTMMKKFDDIGIEIQDESLVDSHYAGEKLHDEYFMIQTELIVMMMQ